MICFSFVASSRPVISTPLLFAFSLVDPPVTSTTVLPALNPNLVSVSPKCSTYCGISISPDAVISFSTALLPEVINFFQFL